MILIDLVKQIKSMYFQFFLNDFFLLLIPMILIYHIMVLHILSNKNVSKKINFMN